MTEEIVKRIERYASMCVQTESRGPFDANNSADSLQSTGMDFLSLVSG